MNIYALSIKLDQNKCSYMKLAKLLGIGRSTLYRKLSGQSEFTCGEISKIRHSLKLDDKALVEIFFHNTPI